MTGSSSRRARSPPSPPRVQGDIIAARRSTRLRRSSTSLGQGDMTAARSSSRRSSPSPSRVHGDMTAPSRSSNRPSSPSPLWVHDDMTTPSRSSNRPSSPSPPRVDDDMTAPSRSSSRPSSPSPAGANALDDDDLVGEILLRISPQPPCRVKASCVSKRWKSTINDRYFLKRFRIHHCKPPLLGILCGHEFVEYVVNFRPTEKEGLSIPCDHLCLLEGENVRGWKLVDCRHGFALFEDLRNHQGIIWDPVGETFDYLSLPKEFQTPNIRHWAVLCTDKTEDHMHGCCHWSLRRVILMAIYKHQDKEVVIASFYSGEWSSIIQKTASVGSAMSPGSPSILVGNTLNWLLTMYGGYYIQFDLGSQSLSVIHFEIKMPRSVSLIHSGETDDGLALANLVCPLDGSPAALQLWEKKDESSVAIWELVKSSPLKKVPKLEVTPQIGRSSIVCYAEDAHTIFINVHNFVYMVDLKTMEVSFICKEGDWHCTYDAFTSFYCEDEAKTLP